MVFLSSFSLSFFLFSKTVTVSSSNLIASRLSLFVSRSLMCLASRASNFCWRISYSLRILGFFRAFFTGSALVSAHFFYFIKTGNNFSWHSHWSSLTRVTLINLPQKFYFVVRRLPKDVCTCQRSKTKWINKWIL